jgi:mRNA export factor
MASFGGFGAAKPQQQVASGKPQERDYTFPDAPQDSYSCLALNGTQQQPTSIVCAGAWDGSVKCFQLTYNGQQLGNVTSQGAIKHDAPVLCTDFSSDQCTNFSAGCDGQVRMWNVTQGPSAVQTVGKHDQPVRCMKWMPELNCLATGSWDKTIRLWDLRQQQAAMTLQLDERVYNMDAAGKIVVCTTADNNVHAWGDVTQQNAKFSYKSPLKYQARAVSIFQDREGFALGCIEGRVAIEYFSEAQQKAMNPNHQKSSTARSFVFKCHRDAATNDIYSVNAIDFHNQNTFLTAGGDGSMAWWDKDARSRLATRDYYKFKGPLAAAKFSPMGDALFYVVAYDWSRGADGSARCPANMLIYHQVNPTDIAPKPKKK